MVRARFDWMAVALVVAGACGSGKPGPGSDAGQTQCQSGSARCTRAEQCCANRCDFSPGKPSGAGLCGGLELIEGPLVSVSPEIKAADMRLRPPEVKEVRARKDSDGGTIYMVRFEEDKRLGQFLALRPDGHEIQLRDDGKEGDQIAGDRVFATRVPVKFEVVRAANRRTLGAINDTQLPVPIYRGREVIGTRKFDMDLTLDDIPILLDRPPTTLEDQKKFILVTDPRVVEDPSRTFDICTGTGTPMGKWTFGYLMEQMANQAATGIDPAEFALAWIRLWQTDQRLGETVTAPAAGPFLEERWPRLPDGRLDLARAPFKLKAIVNRIDLAGNVTFGPVSGAEGRFVFQFEWCADAQAVFDFIFEYGVPRRTCGALQDWASQWLALMDLPLGSPEYNARLEAITEQFAARNADPSKPNGSALNQLRSNQNQDPFWEFREFKLLAVEGGTPRLRQVILQRTPDNAYRPMRDRNPDLAAFINLDEAAILDETYSVPATFPSPPGGDFAAASIRFLPNALWHAPGIRSPRARFLFSVNTCDACHGMETRTQFAHIGAEGGADRGREPHLSRFLTGITVPDFFGDSDHTFGELARRAQIVQQLAIAGCGPTVDCSRVPCPVDELPFPGVPFPLPPLTFRPILSSH